MKYRYRVYDHHQKCWLPGDYSNKDLVRELGVKAEFSKYASCGGLLRNQYTFEIVSDLTIQDENKRIPPSLLGEWDRTRLKILGRGK